MKPTRTRTTSSAAIVAALALTLAACGGGGSGGSAGGGDITLGVIGPQSGPQAEIGQNQVAGAEVAAAEINATGGVDGKKIKIVNQDEQSTPATASAAVRKLSGDGVSLQLGMLSSANCLAVAPTLPNQNVVLVTTGCTNDGLTGTPGQTAPYTNLFRVNTPDSLIVSALGKTIAKKFPQITNYTAFGYDYVTGRTEWKLYQDTAKANGLNLNVSRETFVPLAEQNFRPYVSSLAGDPGDPATKALYLGLYGGGTAGFLQQAPDFNLGQKYGLTVQPGGYYPVARALNGKAPDVWNSYDYNYSAFNSDLNTKFVSDFTAKTGKKPVSWSYDAYQGVYAYAAAIKKAGSTDTAAVIKALAGIQYDSPVGKLSIDATTHQSNTPAVVFESVGDPTAPEGVKIKATEIVKPG